MCIRGETRILLLEFPITGDLRLPLLIMEIIYVVSGTEFSLIFFKRYFKTEKELRNLEEFGYASLFFGFSLMSFFYIISDFYSLDDPITPFFIWNSGNARYIFLNCGYFTMLMAGISFLFCIESSKVYFFKKYFFTVIFSIWGGSFVVLFLIDMTFTQPVTYAFWGTYVIFLMLYLVDFTKKVNQNRQKLIYGLLKYLPGFILSIFGFLCTTSMITSIFGHTARFYGTILQLLGLIFIFSFFIGLPPFAEFEWQNSIESILVLNNSGIAIYSKVFQDKGEVIDKNLVGGALTGVKALLDNLTDTSGVSVLQKKGKIIVIYPSKNLTGVMFCSKDLNILRVLLQKFIVRIESVFKTVLADWDGDPSVFKPVEYICDEIFKES